MFLKWKSKIKKLHNLNLFQACVRFFLQRNIKYNILKNRGIQTVAGLHKEKIQGTRNCLLTHILQNNFCV